MLVVQTLPALKPARAKWVYNCTDLGNFRGRPHYNDHQRSKELSRDGWSNATAALLSGSAVECARRVGFGERGGCVGED